VCPLKDVHWYEMQVHRIIIIHEVIENLFHPVFSWGMLVYSIAIMVWNLLK